MGSRIYARGVEDICGYRTVVSVKAVRRISLRIADDGTLMLSVPMGSGVDYRAFVRENLTWIERTRARMTAMEARRPQLTYELLREFEIRVREAVPRWEMAMGLKASKITLRAMKSRWGSCNHHTRAVTLNSRLAQYPAECTDYVIVHELAHIVHLNHSADFWALVSRYFPEWKRVRNSLR